MDAVQAVSADPSQDRVVGETELAQLPSRDDPVLASGELRDRAADRCTVGNARHACISHCAG